MLHYGITQIDGKPRAVVCFGFAEVRKLIEKGHALKFKAFHNSDSAKEYVMETMRYVESERERRKLEEHRLAVLKARELEEQSKRKGLRKWQSTT